MGSRERLEGNRGGNKEAGRATEGNKGLERVPNTHTGPAPKGRGRSHICVGLIRVGGRRQVRFRRRLCSGERSLHYFQPKPSPTPSLLTTSSSALTPRSQTPNTLSLPWLEGLGAGGWTERAGASWCREEREKLRGWAWLPEGQGGWVPRMKAVVGEPERVEELGQALQPRRGGGWGPGLWAGGGEEGGGEQRPSLLTNTSPD